MVARQAHDAAASALGEIRTHTAVCSERAKSIDDRLRGLAEGQAAVRGFLGKAMWVIMAGLIIIIGFALQQISTNDHWFGTSQIPTTTVTK